jgi:predicted nucleic acid-binding protein
VKLAIDTNVLAYAEGVNGAESRERAEEIISRIPREMIVVPTQVVAELFHLLLRKGGQPRPEAWRLAGRWLNSYESAPTSPEVMNTAMNLALHYEFQIFDAMILAAAAEAKCSLLLTEDMHEGFTWNGVTITNPFKPNRHVWLDLLLNGESQN